MSHSDATYRALVELAPDALVVVDLEGRIAMANRQAESVFGYSHEELIGQPVELLIPDRIKGVHARHREIFAADPRLRPMGTGVELHARRKDGSEFPAEISLSPIDAGETRLVLAAIRDVTEQRRLQASLRQSLREKDSLLMEVHHRVKNNLQIIASMLRLQSESADREAQRVLSASQNRVRAIALIHELLYQSAELGVVSMDAYVRRIVAGLAEAYAAETRMVEIDLDIGDIHLPMDTAIPCGLILSELVSNAFKYAFSDGRRGRLTVRVAPGNQTIVLVVKDDGVGLPPAFDVRTGRTLGLQLVRALVGQLGGRVETVPGHGAEFVVTFSPKLVRAPA